MKKLIALVLAAVMLFSCAAMAQTATVTINVNGMGETMADVTVTVGNDEDGCTQSFVAGNVGATILNAFAQVYSEGITFSVNGDEPKTITFETIAALAQEISGVTVPAVQTEEDNIFMQYVSSEAFMTDVQIVSGVLVNEVNKLAQAAAENGIVTMDEAGNLTIMADVNTLLALVKTYVTALAADTTVIPTLATTTLWSLLGLSEGGAEEMAIISALVAQLDAIDVSGITAALILNVSAEGAVTVNLTYAAEADTFIFSFDASELGVQLNVAYNTQGMPVIALNAAVDFVMGTAAVDGTVMGSTFAFNAELLQSVMGGKASLTINGDTMQVEAGMTEEGTYNVQVIGNDEMVVSAVVDIATFSARVDIMGGMYLTLAPAISENGTQFVGAFGMVMEDGTEMEMYNATLAIVTDDTATLTHVNGTAMSDDEVNMLLTQLMFMFAAVENDGFAAADGIVVAE